MLSTPDALLSPPGEPIPPKPTLGMAGPALGDSTVENVGPATPEKVAPSLSEAFLRAADDD